jgi:hypothetical protein
MVSSAAASVGITVLAGIYVSVGALSNLSGIVTRLTYAAFVREQLHLVSRRSSAFNFMFAGPITDSR